MATHPTRLQQQARDLLAEALFLITSADRRDGKGRLDRSDLKEIARQIAEVSSAFERDEIVALAVEKRARSLGLPASTVELILLVENGCEPLDTLLLSD